MFAVPLNPLYFVVVDLKLAFSLLKVSKVS